MSHRCLTELRGREAETFYLTALKYGHYLWLKGHSGRAILAITRALYADIDEKAEILMRWPLPYAALKWIVANNHSDDFPGNPRISFQHQATRLGGDRQALRRARAWAVWALISDTRPSLAIDTAQVVKFPSLETIEAGLHAHCLPGEVDIWKSAF